LLFLEISWFASFSLLEGGCNVPRPTRSTPGGSPRPAGGSGSRFALGGAMLWRMFDLSEPAWETGDDRAKVEGSQCSSLVPA